MINKITGAIAAILFLAFVGDRDVFPPSSEKAGVGGEAGRDGGVDCGQGMAQDATALPAKSRSTTA